MYNSLTNQQKVAAIRDFNQRQGLPVENPANVLFNGALFEAPELNQDLFLFPFYEFEQPLSAYSREKQVFLLTKYGATLARFNRPRAVFIGVPGREPGNLSVTIHTIEVNLKGYWTQVQRTVFLHQATRDNPPKVSLDIIATSIVPAPPDHNNCLRAPDDIWYIRPADLRTWLADESNPV
jgi:hypothetical protein